MTAAQRSPTSPLPVAAYPAATAGAGTLARAIESWHTAHPGFEPLAAHPRSPKGLRMRLGARDGTGARPSFELKDDVRRLVRVYEDCPRIADDLRTLLADLEARHPVEAV